MNFHWHPDEPPPSLEEHSKAKLDVLRSYLQAYFDKLNVIPHRDEFRLALVDGFAGGGTFLDGGNIVSGTPLIMLEETMAAGDRLNRNRKKPLRLDCRYYFVDKESAHVDHLKKVLNNRGHPITGGPIVVRNERFEAAIGGIIKDIRQHQPRVGRSIFLLDQTGFSQVTLEHIAQIFRELPAAEVILTFAANALVNHLAERPELIKAVAPLQLTESLIRELVEQRDSLRGRAAVQRTLREHIRMKTGASFDTPFFIKPRQSRRALWFLHLSRHPTARDVMIQRHWAVSNTFEHYGVGDFGMLGWDALISPTIPLFHFEELEAIQVQEQLLSSLPDELFSLASENPITVDTMRHMFANRTTARFSDIDKAVLQLFREREIEILDPDGKLRSVAIRRLRPNDRIAFPKTLLLPSFSRRR